MDESVMCESIVEFINKQKSKKRRDMFVDLITAFATSDENEAAEILYGKVHPIIKREDLRDLVMSLSDDLFKVIPFKQILNELEK